VGRKIDKYYKYLEVDQGNGITAFGWTDADSIDKNQDYVLSYPSRSKKTSEEDLEWSSKEGCSATALVDYATYVERLTGESPQDFFDEWEEKIDLYDESKENWREGSAEFILNLCRLILGEKASFTQFGRVYKRVNVES
jgi:hypothetical protein